MNNARFNALVAGLNGAAKKVLLAVPIAEAWTPHQVTAEITRQAGPMERRIVDGCLRQLVDSGLVRELRHGHFQRAALKADPERSVPVPQPQEEETMPMQKAPPPETPADPLARMAAVAGLLRAFGAEVATRCNALAAEVEDSALAMEQRVDKAAADAANLRKLQDLLRVIGQPS